MFWGEPLLPLHLTFPKTLRAPEGSGGGKKDSSAVAHGLHSPRLPLGGAEGCHKEQEGPGTHCPPRILGAGSLTNVLMLLSWVPGVEVAELGCREVSEELHSFSLQRSQEKLCLFTFIYSSFLQQMSTENRCLCKTIVF